MSDAPDNRVDVAGRQRTFLHVGPNTLRPQLALWHLAALSLTLIVFGSGIFLEVHGSLLQGIDGALQSRAEAISTAVDYWSHGFSLSPK